MGKRRQVSVAEAPPIPTDAALRARLAAVAGAQATRFQAGPAGYPASPIPPRQETKPAQPAQPGWIWRHKELIARVAFATGAFYFLAFQAQEDIHSLETPGCQLIIKNVPQQLKTVRDDLFEHGIANPGKITYVSPDGLKHDFTGQNDSRQLAPGSSLVMTDVPYGVCDAEALNFGQSNHISPWSDPVSIVVR